MIVFVDKVRFLRITVHLQADFLVVVFQLSLRDQVILLHVRHIVHRLCVPLISVGLPVDVPQSKAHHAQQHQESHEPHSQRNCRPLEAILDLPVGYRRGDGSEELAVRPGEAGCADAGGWRSAWSTSSCAKTPVEAGKERALVQDSVAVASAETCGTGASVVVDPILAGSSIQTGVPSALVDVDFAALAGESSTAATHSHAAMNQTETTISAGKRRALVHSLFAVESGVAAGTLAHIAAAIVLLPAFTAVEARGVCTRQQAVLAVGALKTLGTRACVARLQICAYSTVPAGVAVTLLHLQLTVDAGETRQAGTGVAALSCVHAGGAVHTGPMMGAEVEVLVT